LTDKPIRLKFPPAPEAPELRSVLAAIARHLTHTDLGYVLPIIQTYLPLLMLLDVTLEVPVARKVGGTCLRAVEGDTNGAQRVFAQMAGLIVKRDPFKLTTVNEARDMLGLAPQADPFAKDFIAKVMASLRANTMAEQATEHSLE